MTKRGPYQLQVTREEMKVIGQRFKKLRLKAALTQDELAELLFVHVSTYRRWEWGRRIPSEDVYLLEQKIMGIAVRA